MPTDYVREGGGRNVINASPGRWRTISPSDEQDLPFLTTCLWIGDAGDGTLTVTTEEGTTELFEAVPTGLFIGRFSRVWKTGTGVSKIKIGSPR